MNWVKGDLGQGLESEHVSDIIAIMSYILWSSFLGQSSKEARVTYKNSMSQFKVSFIFGYFSFPLGLLLYLQLKRKKKEEEKKDGKKEQQESSSSIVYSNYFLKIFLNW